MWSGVLINEHSEAIEDLHSLSAPGAGWEFGQPVFAPPQREWFLAQITAKDGGTPPAYSWTALPDLNEGGTPLYEPDPPQGGPGLENPPLYEAGGNPDVPPGAIVQAWPSEEADQWQFFYPRVTSLVIDGGGGSVSWTDVTVTWVNNTFDLTDNNWNVAGDIYNLGTLSKPVYVSYSYGVFQFPAWTNPAAAPPAYLVLPYLSPGPPTWVPALPGIQVCAGPWTWQSGPGPGGGSPPPPPVWYPYPATYPAPPPTPSPPGTPAWLPVYSPVTQTYVIPADPIVYDYANLSTQFPTAVVVKPGADPGKPLWELEPPAGFTDDYLTLRPVGSPSGTPILRLTYLGLLDFPASASLGTPPAARLGLPVMTPSGTPTYPGPAEGEILWGDGGGVIYLYDGSTWKKFSPDPMTTLGDILYEDATPAAARLAGNTTTTRKFLGQTGGGGASAAPAWDALQAGDMPGVQTISLGGTPTLSGQPSWVKATVHYTDLSVAATSKTVTLAALPANAALHLVKSFCRNAFAGVTVGSSSCGYSGGVGGASNVGQYGGFATLTGVSTVPLFSATGQPDDRNPAGWNVTGTFTGTANLSGLTAGDLDVWLLLSQAG